MYISFGVSYCAACSKWTEHRLSSKTEGLGYTMLDVELSLFMTGAMGMLMIATWELEPSSFAQICHYIGAALCCIMQPTAFMLQQDFSMFSITFCSLTLFGLIEWFVLVWNLPVEHENLSIVHKLSKISIINELVVLMMAYACA